MQPIEMHDGYAHVTGWFHQWFAFHLALYAHTYRSYTQHPPQHVFDVWFDAWKNRFIKRGLHDRDVAFQVSVEMTTQRPPAYLSDHLSVILKRAAEINRERGGE